ncbi:MAG: ring-cleaving dioxygenase, partial [Thermoanaerobaculia bacterium]|nr:ring-cleaving dioxygenase [Thermoanaerobaculia bacterium]
PGTDLTFFPWPDMAPGRPGTGLASEVQLAVPVGSGGYWQDRLGEHGVVVAAGGERLGAPATTFRDPDGLALALVEVGDREAHPWAGSPVPAEHQIVGLHSVRLDVATAEPTERLLEETMGFRRLEVEGSVRHLGVEGAGSGCRVEVAEDAGTPQGRWGPGTVHHVAWRLRDEEEEIALREVVAAGGHRPTPVIDRFWFRSVYFREPGGVLFELATDGPGFTVDEPEDSLGERLILPPWLEDQRAEIEADLPDLV